MTMKKVNFLNGPILTNEELSNREYNIILKKYYICIQNVIDLPNWDNLIRCDLGDFYKSKQKSGNLRYSPTVSYKWVLGKLNITINNKYIIFITENENNKRFIEIPANSIVNSQLCKKIIEKIYEISPELAEYFYIGFTPITSIERPILII